jgi:plasmid maintenance system antidote protein VapI
MNSAALRFHPLQRLASNYDFQVFGNSPDFWLNVQRRSDLWEAMNSPRERERIERAKPLGAAA